MSQDSWENLALLGAFIVVVGVALESVDWFSKFRRRNRHESILSTEPSWTLVLEFFSISLVVLGLCLEIFATYKASIKAREKTEQLTHESNIASDKSAAAEKDAGDSKVFASQIGTTNAWLVSSNLTLSLRIEELRSNNLLLAKQYVELVGQVEEMTTNVAALSNFLNAPNIMARLNEEKNALAELHEVTTNSQMAAVIKAVKPLEPFKKRLIDWFNSLNPQILDGLKSGQTKFRLLMASYQYDQLQQLADERDGASYIKFVRVNTINSAREVLLILNPELLK